MFLKPCLPLTFKLDCGRIKPQLFDVLPFSHTNGKSKIEHPLKISKRIILEVKQFVQICMDSLTSMGLSNWPQKEL